MIPEDSFTQGNPVVRLAEQLEGKQFTNEQIESRSILLAKESVPPLTILQAVQSARQLSKSIEHADLVFKISAFIFNYTSNFSDAEECHYMAGDRLDQVNDAVSLNAAAWHYQKCREFRGPSRLAAILNESSVRYRLAGHQINPLDNLEIAAKLVKEAALEIEVGTPEHFHNKCVEACVLIEFAFNGVDAIENTAQGILVCDEIIESGPYPSPAAAQALLAKARALKIRGELGLCPIESYSEGIAACQSGRDCIDAVQDRLNFSSLLIMECELRMSIAQLGIDPISNVQEALQHSENAEHLLQDEPNILASSWANRAVGNQLLAKWLPQEAPERVETARMLAKRVISHRPSDHIEAVSMRLCEANCHFILAERGETPIQHLQQALTLLNETKNLKSRSVGLQISVAVTEATVRKQLAENGIDAVENLREAINSCVDAGSRLGTANSYRGMLYIVRAAAHARLADFGIEPLKNLQAAAFLCTESGPLKETSDVVVMKSQLDAAVAMRKLAQLGVRPIENLQDARNWCQQVLSSTRAAAIENPMVKKLKSQALAELANAYGAMASMTAFKDPPEQLRVAIGYATEAHDYVTIGSIEHADLLLNEAIFRLSLAKSCEKAKEEEAPLVLELTAKIADHYETDSQKWAISRTIAAEAQLLLGDKEACVVRLTDALSAFEKTRSWLGLKETEWRLV